MTDTFTNMTHMTLTPPPPSAALLLLLQLVKDFDCFSDTPMSKHSRLLYTYTFHLANYVGSNTNSVDEQHDFDPSLTAMMISERCDELSSFQLSSSTLQANEKIRKGGFATTYSLYALLLLSHSISLYTPLILFYTFMNSLLRFCSRWG